MYGFVVHCPWFRVWDLWFKVSDFGADLVCVFGFRFHKCFRVCRVSDYGLLLRLCLWFLGSWFMVYDCGFRVWGVGFRCCSDCGFGFHGQKYVCVRVWFLVMRFC